MIHQMRLSVVVVALGTFPKQDLDFAHSIDPQFIEFFRGRPRGGDDFTSLFECSRPGVGV